MPVATFDIMVDEKGRVLEQRTEAGSHHDYEHYTRQLTDGEILCARVQDGDSKERIFLLMNWNEHQHFCEGLHRGMWKLYREDTFCAIPGPKN
jgi:hypothetical protein